MYGLPKDIDVSFFVGKTLNVVSFAVNVVHLIFDDGISINIESSYRHQQKHEVEHHQLGTMQSVYMIEVSPIMQLAGHAVVAALGTKDGTLTLTFDHGQVLHCLDDMQGYECYNFTDGEKLWIV
jgi:Family of unknown function (DUF6188)